jgi:cell division protein FtsI (penicillin-binding protein 3)
VAAPAAGAVIRRVAPILGMVPETDRIPQIQQTISIPLQPGRPAGAAPKPPTAAAAPPATAAGRGNAPAGAAPLGRPPGTPLQQAPVAPALPQPPSLRRTELPAAFRLAAFPAPSDEAGLAPR